MSNQAVKKYIQNIRYKYHQSSKKEKSDILNHSELALGRSRSHIKRLLNQSPQNDSKKRQTGRPPTYSKTELLPHIKYLWEQMEKIAAPRMKAALPDWFNFYKDCPPHLRLQLLRMSSSTLDRYLSEIRSSLKARKGISTTCPARHMKNKVPINTLDSKIKKPGFTQTDTVAHCGNSSLGPFISSLTVTDICTAWTENRALFTKRGIEVIKNFKNVEKRLPFKLLAINSDSGSEFLNKEMLKFTNHGHRVIFTRSRPYKKNDNCYVEQKNFTHVRELFAYERFDEEILVDLMNEIYTEYWNPLQNYFLPTFKLKEKVRIGARIKKTYDKPKTPYTRLMESPYLSNKEKKDLRERKLKLNPFELKRNLEIKLKEFFEVVRKKDIRKAA